jgi:hypothetical protein
MNNEFSLGAIDNGMKITLTVAWLPGVLPSFAPLCGLDDETRSDVCCAAFAASAQELADTLNQALVTIAQHAFEARLQRVAADSSFALPNVIYTTSNVS